VQRLTTYQIAERFGVTNARISQILKQFEINRINKRRSFERNKDYTLDERQIQLMIGGLLGDSYLSPSYDNKSARLRIGHCAAQKEYLEWKKNFFVDIASNTKTNIDNKGFVSCYFATKCIPALKEYRDLFYKKDGTKIITREILNRLSPLGLAIWVMDDGCRDKSNNKIVLYTNCFTLKEQEIIKQYFEDAFNIPSSIKSRVYAGNPKRYYFLALTTRGSRKLSNIIRPFVVESMRYKLVD